MLAGCSSVRWSRCGESRAAACDSGTRSAATKSGSPGTRSMPTDPGLNAPALRDRLRRALAPPSSFLPRPLRAFLSGRHSCTRSKYDGVTVLIERPEVLLADDMGLGKTVQAIAALRILMHSSRADVALVITSASLVHQWRIELNKWAPEVRVSTIRGIPEERAKQWSYPAHIFLTSYETLRSDFSPNVEAGPRRRIWDVVVLDEAQKIKNRDTDTRDSARCCVGADPGHLPYTLGEQHRRSRLDNGVLGVESDGQPRPRLGQARIFWTGTNRCNCGGRRARCLLSSLRRRLMMSSSNFCESRNGATRRPSAKAS